MSIKFEPRVRFPKNPDKPLHVVNINLTKPLNSVRYYNGIESMEELNRLRFNTNLKDLDLRLNPITRTEPDYRLYLIHMLPNLQSLGRSLNVEINTNVGIFNLQSLGTCRSYMQKLTQM